MDDIDTKNTRRKGLEDILFKRGYPKEIITIGINKARALNQKELRTPQPRQTTENILTFVTTFNPNNPSITSQLQTSLTILKSTPKMKSASEGTKIIHSRRQPPNLKQLLVKSKLTNRTEGIVSKCGGKRCTTCEQLIVRDSFHFKSSNYPFKVKHDMDCNNKFVLYVLTCAGCGENYIGETKTKLRERMTLH